MRIERLGEKGDGIGAGDGRAVVVPLTAPGDLVETEAGHLIEILEHGAHRATPFCSHFGICGGCRLQHVLSATYGEWKRQTVQDALSSSQIDALVAPLVSAHGAGRRRATFHVVFEHGKARAGFMAARSHTLVDLDGCPVLVEPLRTAPILIRSVVEPLAKLGKPLDVQVTWTLGGIDVDIRGAGKAADAERLALTAHASRADVARLSIHGDIVVERRPPLVRIGKALVNPPAGGFLQATEAGEQALAGLVQATLGDEKRIADLFCGVGPFAVRLAEKFAVDAFDSDKSAILALDRAARGVRGLKPLRAEARDLFRRPLLAHEIRSYDAIVLDPPRSGAAAQVGEIARALHPAKIVYVSCDKGSFARDARVLIDAGWTLEKVTPVDQFAFTAHVELVGVFSRHAPALANRSR